MNGVAVTEASDALHGRLSDREAHCESMGWAGSRGRNITMLSTVRLSKVVPGAEESPAAPRIVLHNKAIAVTARLVVAMTMPRSSGGLRERVTVAAATGVPLILPDSASDILITVDVQRIPFSDAWCVLT